MACRVRAATADDLPFLAAITGRYRRRLAAWEPEYWRIADGADAAHEEWLRQAVDAEDIRVRVLVSDDPGGTSGFGWWNGPASHGEFVLTTACRSW